MEANISRWIILLLALVCAVQAASAFDVKTATVNPTSGDLEPDQSVTAHYVIAYNMDPANSDGESFDFSTGLRDPAWTFIVYRDGIPIYTTEKTGYYPSLGSFELAYNDKVELDVQLRGTVPKTSSGEVEIVKLEHIKNRHVEGTPYRMTRKVVSVAPTTVPAATFVPSGGAGSGTGTSSGSLDIRSTPSGANIYLNGMYYGVTPTVISGLPGGTHQIKILRSGYYDYTLITTVTAGKTAAVSATLTPISTAYSTTSDVAGVTLAESSLSTQQQNLNDLKADIDARAAEGVDVSAAQAKYDVASQALMSAASAGPSQAAGHIATATKNIDEGKSLLDRAWAEKEVSNTAAAIETLDGMITYFVEDRSMGSDPQVVSLVTKRESAIQFYSQAKDNLNANNYPLARSKATDGQNKANDALSDADALRDEIGEGSNFDNILLYAGIGVVGLLVLIAIVLRARHLIHSRQNRRKRTQNGGAGTGEARPSGSPVGHDTGKTPRHRGTNIPPSVEPVGLSKADVSDRKKSGSSSDVILPDGGTAESTAKPDLTITLSHTSIHADEWDKVGLTLVNAGTTPAFDITLTFSNDVDTRLLRPVDLAAGENITIDVGIKPRTKGKIPLEITARYRDAGKRTYKQITSCWLSVEPRSDSVSPSSPIPSSISRPVTPKSLPPEMTDRYTASEYLGRGGFARVFKVQKQDGSWAALKIPISLDAATGRSFIAELQNWTSMVHENIVRVQDYNIMPLPYFELELCDGTLAELEKPVPPDHAAWLIFNICEGLKYAHARGILHRDLKPQNIMIRDGVPKISDWGLSKVMTQSRTTTVSGGFTAYYAAPEQISNKPKDERTDIWQLGVILYELVTDKLPFTGESMVEIGMAIATETPERPGAVHPDAQPLDAIILKCLEKNPEQRYQSVVDLQNDLAAYLKLNYAESLKESVQVNDLHRSAYYCGDLVLISMKIGDLVGAHKYAVDLARYSAGEIRTQATELAAQIKLRVEMGAQELPGELVQKAEVIVHQVRMR